MGDGPSDTMKTTTLGVWDVERVTRELFVELLAHQFAFPVQWINTQATLLNDPRPCQRLVELGPSSTLVGMARKTIQRQIAAGHRAPGATQLLASTVDMSLLSYQYDSLVQDDLPTAPEIVSTAEVPKQTGNVPDSDTAPSVVPIRVVAEIPDVPVHPADVVRALVARKLKKSMVEVSVSRSLKELCNGKSTLQNELVGDLGAEFGGNLPYAPEDLSLIALGEATMTTAQDSEAGVPLGKTSSTLLDKLVSAKLPPGSSVKAMRTYLGEQWGLKKGRQTAVLLFVMTSEPEARLTSEKAVHQYLDGVSNMYAAWSGLTLQASSAEVGIKVQQPGKALDPAVAAQLLESNSKLARKQFEALSDYLALNESPSNADAETVVAKFQSKLDCWNAEFSEDFLAWVSPLFDAKMSRRYNAYWRSARQELLQFYGSRLIPNESNVRLYPEFRNAMANKADPELNIIARSQGRQLRARHSPRLSDESRMELVNLEKSIARGMESPPRVCPTVVPRHPSISIAHNGDIQYAETPRSDSSSQIDYADLLSHPALHVGSDIDIRATIKVHQHDDWPADVELTGQLLASLRDALTTGMNFSGKHVLVTGAGNNSIGAAVIRLLLAGGARVIMTTSREPSSVAESCQKMYETEGARGSELVLLPFNQASAADCDRLIDYIYDPKGLNRDLDAILPFAAIAEGGMEIHEIGARSEFAHRVMLTNVLRLLGRLIKNKRSRGIDCNPTQVILPLSPNHGTFGGDGLYTESKLGLESLLQRVHSESWQDHLSICGVNIGWTRSTGLMNLNDMIAPTVEQRGVLTFSVAEMALNIATLMIPQLREMCEEQTPIVDFSGGLGQLEGCHAILDEARKTIRQKSTIAKAVYDEKQHESDARNHAKPSNGAEIRARTTLQVGFPRPPDYSREIQPLQRSLSVQADPAKTVVVVGFSELGPLGSARTRWDWEIQARFSTAATIELAWMMGLITYVSVPRGHGQYAGWVDTKTEEAVMDDEIERRYGAQIRAHSGVRALDPEVVGYDPEQKEALEEISIGDDLPSFETSPAVAEAFKRRHGEHVRIRIADQGDRCQVQFKRGATILVPKASRFRWGGVAGQLPSGFDPRKYGIPDDLVQQLDPVSLYAVCCVAEAFYSAGMPDPSEIFKHIHPAEIGNFIGTSMGGALKTRHLYKDVFLGRPVDSDILQDTYANTTAAWVNMLLLGAIGPIKTPVGACATGVESLDSGFDSIMSGKIRMCIVGGVDDLQEDEAHGFSLLKATANMEDELAKGRPPSEMSRPTAESRAGFVEAHGCGVQLLCRADLAIEMGLPIYGIVAGSAMAADGVSRSVPAPGQGILSFARENGTDAAAKILDDMEERSDSDTRASGSTSQTLSNSDSSTSTSVTGSSDDEDESEFTYETPLTPPEHMFFSRMSKPQLEHPTQQIQPSPLRAALMTWGLSVDDIGVASLHGTSTKANDTNEPEVLCAQMDHLGRTRGRPIWVICQKAVTGHPKAPAAAWMLNGCLQAMQRGLVPGNRNADNIDPAWRKFEHLCLPTSPVRTDIRAFMLTSFGFGQKGGQMVGVAPNYLFATQSRATYDVYAQKTLDRCAKADREFAKALTGNRIVQILKTSPWTQKDLRTMFLDPTARLGPNGTIVTSRPSITKRLGQHHQTPELTAHVRRAMRQTSVGKRLSTPGWSHNVHSIGIDMVHLAEFDSHLNETFINRNFTSAEVASAQAHVDVRAAYAGRWCAKEAVFKCLHTHSRGSSAAMKLIEIITLKGGMPIVSLDGDAKLAAKAAGLSDISISMSYEGEHVIAIAIGLT